MRDKLRVLVVTLLCFTLTALPAWAEPVTPPELEQMMNDQTRQVITELPPRLSVDYIADITHNLVRYVQKLPNGNLLLCRVGAWMPGIVEVDRQGNEVWNYYGIQANSAQRLANGNTLIADAGAPGAPYVPRVVELTRDGKKAWEYTLPSLAYAPRYAERLPSGNTLVVLPFEVREVTPQKKVVWQYGPGKPAKPGTPDYLARPSRAHRLANGNTLIVDRGYAGNGRVLEVTPGKKVVWQFAATETSSVTSTGSQEQKPPGLVEPLDALRLADGSTLVTDKKQDMVFLVDARGQALQARTWAGLYKTAPVTDLWFAEPGEDGNVLISATMVTGRTRAAEIIGDSMKVVWEKSDS
ncbi:hypothetical protein [Desulforamulus putei]|uniref:PQQ-like domain-containing protein n=1 Tax=Desulforamulus putei DSM 12395 TaxID=1121429 RepID=A0A1M4VE79_9FIRM|nr:hypothetical protein [Desulforamulus putei]SHE67286.1 hypothetical protein SAMN02745133_00900 [Desulforamulus putei DSM 12395]